MSFSEKKTAVVLMNLGGPDSLDSVHPFLRNLFSDPAIIGVPGFIRFFLARFIAWKRAPVAREIYKKIGGRSPILEHTQKQARALESKLSSQGEARVFSCMRYWHPMTEETLRTVKEYAPDQLILLPLYPQFSTTTTGSSFSAWEKESKKQGFFTETYRICCYPWENHFVAAQAARVRRAYFQASSGGKTPRILFSAHGLPEYIIRKGDPYSWHVEQSVKKVVSVLGFPGLDFRVCYQSKVGNLAWIIPSTEEEIKKAGAENVPVVIVPISFVSEHSETLVELDVEYRELAEKSGVPDYIRVPALGTEEDFISCLEALCIATLEKKKRTGSHTGERLCPASFPQCLCGE
jgi:ferrochelatase